MKVIWLIQAQEELQRSLGLQNANPEELDQRLLELSQKIEATFPKAIHVVVVERLEGYSQSADKHILRVEVFEEQESQVRIVKLAPAGELAKELAAWKTCEGRSNDRGVVFMAIHAGAQDQPGNYLSLVYEDARRRLPATRVMSLEEAVLNCCQWDVPSVLSLIVVLDTMFADLADRLYCRSGEQKPADEVVRYFKNRLAKSTERWNQADTEAYVSRAVVMETLLQGGTSIYDPDRSLGVLLDEAAPEHLPDMRRGCSHGDLHGRNVLVGVLHGEARWPAVFDYADMGPMNFVGWDFAKLETELKIRAYQRLFPNEERDYVRAVGEFETLLAECTETSNNRPFLRWRNDTFAGIQPAGTLSAEQGRLLAILLAIRMLAKQSLEVIDHRGRAWLHEYYFLLAVYGTYAGRFENFRRPDLVSAYTCAAFAVNRYLWALSARRLPDVLVQEQAQQAIRRNDPAARLVGAPPISYHAPCVFAREFVRSRRAPFVGAAIEMLKELSRQYETEESIWQELALAYAELAQLEPDCRKTHLDRAEGALKEISRRFPELHYEMLCRFGRVYKDFGDAASDSGSQPEARTFYLQSLEKYQAAYNNSGNYYPGINVATLKLLLGDAEESKTTAKQVLDRLDGVQPIGSDEDVWVFATRAEAYLLREEREQAAIFYWKAAGHSPCRPHSRNAMRRQAARILRAQGGSADGLETLFGGRTD
jgi:hypothetical protein